MKQTAVEKLGIAFRQWQTDWDNFYKTRKNKPASYDEFIAPFLEMEKQQQGYTEEEIYELLLKHQSAYRSAVRNTSPLDWSFDIKQWFEQFKNK
jgi:hypothetical protein